jgi:hypothetical protein
MNDISKIELASFVLNEVKKNSLKDLLCSFYGATEVNYRDTTYGICIDIVGSCNFRFIKNAIRKTLDVPDESISTLSESTEKNSATYVYMPENDKILQKRLKSFKSYK